MSEDQYMTVSQFNRNMKTYFDINPKFKNVFVKGEVSGAFTSARGHIHFTLKDKRSVIKCIIYKYDRKNIEFEIKDGMKLLVIANVSVYPPHGKYQLNVHSVTEDGLGKLYVKLQQLKEKLAKEGLFKKEHKKPLPHFPKTIGVVTSKGGSVIHDIIKTVNQNWPCCEILLFPSAVQGPGAAAELVKQIKIADSYNLDVLIVGRGGGSLEDLWSFNEEIVVRAIFNANTPIISAVGHEDDVTLSDLASDKSASTPTAAANMAIEDKDAVKKNVEQLNARILSVMSSKIKNNRKELDFILSKPLFTDSNYIYASKKTDYMNLFSLFEKASSEIVNNNRHILNNIKTSYVIRYPCKMQLNQSKNNLNELDTRLIDSLNSIRSNNRSDLEKATSNFEFYSQKLATSKRHDLEKAAGNFEFYSQNLITSKRHDLEMMERYFISNPCQNQIEASKVILKVSHDKVLNNMNVSLSSNRKDFELLKNNFRNVSEGLLLRNSDKLDSIKNRGIIKNPDKICLSKRSQLDGIKNERFLKTPYLILNPHKAELEKYREKLDNISQVIDIKKEKEKQKSMYTKIIIAFVIFIVMIILMMLIFGGI